MENKKEAYKRKLKELANKEGYISGIHNYCDRWCERCTMTSKCRVFAMENNPENETSRSKDIENQEYWEDIEMTFEAISDFIDEMAEKEGISLDKFEDTEDKLEHEKSELGKEAFRYGNDIMDWLKQNREDVIGIASKYQKEKLKEIENSLEVISWYCFFIDAKIHRADFQNIPLSENETVDEAAQYDKNGSAKIATIAIDRSINAISVLYRNIIEFEDELLPFLIQLSKLKKQVDKEFPEAKNFKRPGFDE